MTVSPALLPWGRGHDTRAGGELVFQGCLLGTWAPGDPEQGRASLNRHSDQVGTGGRGFPERVTQEMGPKSESE